MLIGILQADSVDATLARRHGDYPEMFRRLLDDPSVRSLCERQAERSSAVRSLCERQAEGSSAVRSLCEGLPSVEWLDIDAEHGALPEPARCDAYLITGSRHSVYDPLPWIPPLAEFVAAALELGRPVVGICFGHQFLAHHFGGETRAAPAGWCVGVQEARVIRRLPWMAPFAEHFRLRVSHRDQVVRVPPGAEVFAEGDACPVAGFVMGNALAIQGHPEFPRGYLQALLDRRRELLGDTVYARATASLVEDVDAGIVGAWMLRFISRGQT